MAETSYKTSPKLGIATDEAQAYAPVSWLAVAAAVAALAFVVLFVALAVFSAAKKQPMIMPALLLLPVVTAVLAFAAYCHVKNSEGTRTDRLFGMNLVRTAGAVALLGGGGYVAYLGALEFAVRKDAENVFLEWTKGLENLPTDDSLDVSLAAAVHRTLEPAAQQKLPATDTATIKSAYGEQYTQFSQCDFVRVCRRNPGQIAIRPQGLVNWEREQQKIQCTLNADVVGPEGVHTISLKMLADIAPNGARLWSLQNKPSYFVGRKLTPYGRRVEELELTAGLTLQRFVEQIGPQVAQRMDESDRDMIRRRTYIDFIANAFPPLKPVPIISTSFRAALGGGAATVEPQAIGYESVVFDKIFVPLLPSAGLTPDERKRLEAEMRDKFKFIWNGNRILRSGHILRGSKDVFPILTADGTAIRVSLPFEMVMPGPETASNTTRARATLECSDPTVVGDLAKLRASADPSKAVESSYPEMPKDYVPWKVVRIESDMKPGPMPTAAPGQEGNTPG